MYNVEHLIEFMECFNSDVYSKSLCTHTHTHSLQPMIICALMISPPPYRFVCKNNGVLFENQLLQIGIKSEYRQNLGEFLNMFSS